MVQTRLRPEPPALAGRQSAVERDTYCPEVMKQLSAVQGSLKRASRIVLRNHLEPCVAAATGGRRGRTSEPGSAAAVAGSGGRALPLPPCDPGS